MGWRRGVYGFAFLGKLVIDGFLVSIEEGLAFFKFFLESFELVGGGHGGWEIGLGRGF